MFGRTPPLAMVTSARSLESSSSLRMASCTWRGMMRLFLLSAKTQRRFKSPSPALAAAGSTATREPYTHRASTQPQKMRVWGRTARGVAGELEHLSSEVLHHCGEVHGRARADALGVLALLEETGDTADGELETGLGGPAHGLLAGLALAATRHDELSCIEKRDNSNGECGECAAGVLPVSLYGARPAAPWPGAVSWAG